MFLPSVPVAPTVLLPSANTSTKAAGDMLLHFGSQQDMRNYVKEVVQPHPARKSHAVSPGTGSITFRSGCPVGRKNGSLSGSTQG
jgi:hypothetical protein